MIVHLYSINFSGNQLNNKVQNATVHNSKPESFNFNNKTEY